MPYRKTPIAPPIVVSEASGMVYTLSTVEHVIEYVRRQHEQEGWGDLREAAFVAAALPSQENIDTLRRLTAEALRSARLGEVRHETAQRET